MVHRVLLLCLVGIALAGCKGYRHYKETNASYIKAIGAKGCYLQVLLTEESDGSFTTKDIDCGAFGEIDMEP